MSSKESTSTQMSLNNPKWAEMCLNKLERAWICLNEPK